MRVIAGLFKSRRLKGSPPQGVRPTSDKLRETLFNVLGPVVEGSTFLDCFAGMGGVGIEAISRGAAMVYFVDQFRKSQASIRENLALLGVASGYKILEMDAIKALTHLKHEGTRFDIAFIDPPYEREDLYQACLEHFGTGAILAESGILIVEHSSRGVLPAQSGTLHKFREIKHGDSALTFYREAQP